MQIYCSDDRNESNGIFVLGVGFFRQISIFQLAIYDGISLYNSKDIVDHKFENIFHL